MQYKYKIKGSIGNKHIEAKKKKKNVPTVSREQTASRDEGDV